MTVSPRSKDECSYPDCSKKAVEEVAVPSGEVTTCKTCGHENAPYKTASFCKEHAKVASGQTGSVVPVVIS
jgi:hypothetical protein